MGLASERIFAMEFLENRENNNNNESLSKTSSNAASSMKNVSLSSQ